MTGRRFVLPLAIILACATLLLLAALHPDLPRQLFAYGDALNGNTESNLTVERAEEIARRLQMLLVAAGALAFVALAGQMASSGDGRRRPRAELLLRAAPSLLVVVLGAVLAVKMIGARGVRLEGKHYFYLVDDAMNSMRYARNLVLGHGLSYNPGDHVEGYTNFLWLMLMAAIHWLGAGLASAPLCVLIAGWACLLVTACLTADLLSALDLDRYWQVCVGILLVCDENAMAWANSGLETAALMLAVTTCAWALLRNRPRTFAVALAAVVLVRADGFVLGLGLATVAALTRVERRWSLTRVLAPAALALAAHLVFRRCYYGYWLPNTYYLRMIALPDRLKMGLGGYGLRLATSYPLFLLLCLCAIGSRSVRPVVRLLAAVALGQAAYSVWLGGDIFVRLRFVTPVLPLVFVSAAVVLERLLRSSWKASRIVQVVALSAGSVLAPVEPPAQSTLYGNFVVAAIGTARALERNVPPGTTMTIYAAGTVAYYASTIRFIDVFGKNDAHIAHLPTHRGLRLGHNKLDFRYIYDEQKPDIAFILMSCNEAAAMVANPNRGAANTAVGDVVAHDYDLRDPTFKRLYFPNPVHFAELPAPTPLECLFVRQGSRVPVLWDVSHR